jgi:hypothetical protein
MSTAIDTARELLARTRNISACLDSMVQPHRRVVGLKAELSKGPFVELERTRAELMAELGSIEDLLGRGLVNEACSAINVYEGRVRTMTPSLSRLSAIRRGRRATGASEASLSELGSIEDMVLDQNMVMAESVLAALESAGDHSGGEVRELPAIDKEERTCALCGRATRSDLDLCPYCGWKRDAPTAECPGCGGTVLTSFRSCPSCGKGLQARALGGRMVFTSLNIG